MKALTGSNPNLQLLSLASLSVPLDTRAPGNSWWTRTCDWPDRVHPAERITTKESLSFAVGHATRRISLRWGKGLLNTVYVRKTGILSNKKDLLGYS